MAMVELRLALFLDRAAASEPHHHPAGRGEALPKRHQPGGERRESVWRRGGGNDITQGPCTRAALCGSHEPEAAVNLPSEKRKIPAERALAGVTAALDQIRRVMLRGWAGAFRPITPCGRTGGVPRRAPHLIPVP